VLPRRTGPAPTQRARQAKHHLRHLLSVTVHPRRTQHLFRHRCPLLMNTATPPATWQRARTVTLHLLPHLSDIGWPRRAWHLFRHLLALRVDTVTPTMTHTLTTNRFATAAAHRAQPRVRQL